jgi:hypothetical protein
MTCIEYTITLKEKINYSHPLQERDCTGAFESDFLFLNRVDCLVSGFLLPFAGGDSGGDAGDSVGERGSEVEFESGFFFLGLFLTAGAVEELKALFCLLLLLLLLAGLLGSADFSF